MPFILLRAVCNTAFAQLLRLSQSRRPRTLGVITVNYLVATLLSLALAQSRGGVHYLPPTVGFGLLGGVGYIVSILLLMPAMRASGLAVSMAVLQLSVLVPVGFAMVAFGEMPSFAQGIGIVVATAALALLSLARTVPLEQQAPRFSPLLLLLFCVTGLSGIAMKAFHQYTPPQELPGFMAVLFAVATVGGALVAAARGEWPVASDLAIGAVIGLANAAQLAFLLRALETVQAIIVFPVSSALALVLNALASLAWWGERLNPASALGLVLALAATVLLNIGRG
jgi:drug/metabolite transporter (DMT)-like permease